MPSFLSSFFRSLIALAFLLAGNHASAVTYANSSFPFNWIDSSTHTKIGYNTSPYKFQGLSGCGTSPPIIDDTVSDQIPIGFSFMYAGVAFTQVRIMTNGRLQFNNNTTCGYGSPVPQLKYPQSTLNYTMKIYNNDLDPTLKSDVPAGYNTNCVNRAVCYVSFATIGTAPYRSFVVTWSNVPEWTTGSNPVGAYNLQLILQENGEFIYQYGTDVPGPSAGLGEVGWQAGDTNDTDPVQTGFPINNSAIKFYIPQPVAEYRMEQATLTGGTALDTSGNGHNGTFLGGMLTDPNGRVCRGSIVPSNTSATTIDALNTNVTIPSIGGAGVIDFWYKSNTAWNVKDEQLFDATVANGVYFFLVKRANGDLRFVITDSRGNQQAVETAAITVAAGTWKHIGVTWNFNALAAANSDHMRIYVDGALSKEVTFTTTGTPASTGTLYIGDNRSTFIGQLGTGNSADGAIDEVRIYNYEGGVSLILRDMNAAAFGCATHYAISDTGSGSTCQPTSITVTAHDGNHGNFTLPNNTTTIQLSTSTGRGDWTLISGYGTLNNGTADDGNATYLFNGEYQAVFGLRHGVPGNVTVHVTDGGLVESENQAITLTSCASGSFNACPPPLVANGARCTPSAPASDGSSAYANLLTKLASTQFTLDAVKLTTSSTLDTTFTGNVTVDLLANSVPLDGSTIDSSTNCPKNPSTATIPLGTVAFASGRVSSLMSVAANAFSSVGPYAVYRDVRLRFSCDAATCGAQVTNCSTDAFAVRPTGFALTSDMTGITRVAGASFTLSATAAAGYAAQPVIDNTIHGSGTNYVVLNDGSATPTAALTNIDGNGTPTNVLNLATIADGASVSPAMRFDEIGGFSIVAGGVRDKTFTSVDQTSDCVVGSFSNTADANGKIGCDIANQATSATFSRFYPDHFELNYALSNYCNGFSYMDQQEFGIGMLLNAVSQSGTLLKRYASGSVTVTGENGATIFSPLSTRLSPDFSTMPWSGGYAGRHYTTDPATSHIAGATSIKLAGAGTIVAGDVIRVFGDANKYTVATGTTSAASPIVITPALAADVAGGTTVFVLHKFVRLTSPDGPYDAFSLRATTNDADGVKISKVNGALVTAATSQALGNAVDLGPVRLRYGRMRIDNAYGSDKLDLPVRLTAQFYNGSSAGFVPSTLDNCTPITSASLTMNPYTPAATSANLPAANLQIVTSVLTGGFGSIKLLKPLTTPPITGKFNVQLNSTISHLPGKGTATFGLFKNGPVIYMQEVH